MTHSSGPTGQLEPQGERGLQLLPAPGVHADLAAPPSLAAPDEQGAAALIQIRLGKGERSLDAQPCTPEDHEQRAQLAAVRVVAGGAHDGDDLLHSRRVGRVAQPRQWPDVKGGRLCLTGGAAGQQPVRAASRAVCARSDGRHAGPAR
ncbi:MAG: hypothetical protein ACRDPC_19850 [Solirubrobacteraceae bacterium]